MLICCALWIQSYCWLLFVTSLQDDARPAVETGSISSKPFIYFIINCYCGFEWSRFFFIHHPNYLDLMSSWTLNINSSTFLYRISFYDVVTSIKPWLVGLFVLKLLRKFVDEFLRNFAVDRHWNKEQLLRFWVGEGNITYIFWSFSVKTTFIFVAIDITDCHAVPVGDVWYMFSAEFLHPWKAFLRSSKCWFMLFLFRSCAIYLCSFCHFIFAMNGSL